MSGGGGRREKVGRDDEGVWERRMGRGQVEQILHGKLREGKGTRVLGFRPEKRRREEETSRAAMSRGEGTIMEFLYLYSITVIAL
jgi:hypothetical protein